MTHFQQKYGSLYLPNYFQKELTPDFEQHLLELPWETRRTARHEYFVFHPGKIKMIEYSYGNRNLGEEKYVVKEASGPIIDLMENLNSFLNTDFNACFLNKYDDERQHLGWHADDFAGMRQDQPIAVVSFGAEREIWVKDKRGFLCESCGGDGKNKTVLRPVNCLHCDGTGFTKAPTNSRQPENQRIKLERGSLFVMPVGYQDNYFHRIPKHDRPCGWRISLTFRSFN